MLRRCILQVVLLALTLPTKLAWGQTDQMYWTDSPAGIIQRANLDGTSIQIVVAGVGYPVTIALDPSAGGKIYWTAYGVPSKIQRANLDGTGIEDLVTDLQSPAGIALDLVGGQMYWTEASAGKIQRANLDGTSIEDLVTGLQSPVAIALNLVGGEMYWTEWTEYPTGKIRRANLDGTGIEDLVTGQTVPGGIALDLVGGQIYWGGALYIGRANLDGTDAQIFTPGAAVNGTQIALDLVGGQIYWAGATTGKIQRANLDDLDGSTQDLVTGLSFPNAVALAVPSTTTDKCPLAQGFWKNHAGLWPVSSLTLGTQMYGKSELLALLKTSITTDASLVLARQLIAAKLNIANGSDPSSVSATIVHADGTLSGFVGKLPYKVKPSTITGKAMIKDSNPLNGYNKGLLTPNCTP